MREGVRCTTVSVFGLKRNKAHGRHMVILPRWHRLSLGFIYKLLLLSDTAYVQRLLENMGVKLN